MVDDDDEALSFLDLLSCGLGAAALLFVIFSGQGDEAGIAAAVEGLDAGDSAAAPMPMYLDVNISQPEPTVPLRATVLEPKGAASPQWVPPVPEDPRRHAFLATGQHRNVHVQFCRDGGQEAADAPESESVRLQITAWDAQTGKQRCLRATEADGAIIQMQNDAPSCFEVFIKQHLLKPTECHG